MKQFLTLILLAVTVPLFGQLTGGSGVCVVHGDPDTIETVQERNLRYQCALVFRTDNLKTYYYDSSQTVGSRWVELIQREERPYGEMFIVAADPDTLTFTSEEGSSSPQKIRMSSGLLNGFTHSAGTLTYEDGDTLTVKAKYTVSYNFTESTDMHGWVYLNGSAVDKSKFTRTIQNPNDEDVGSGSTLLQIVEGNTLEFYMAPGTHTGEDELIIDDANFNVIRID